MAKLTLVLLPGMDGTGLLFGRFVAALAGEFDVRVVAYPTDEPLDYPELEAIARTALPDSNPFVIVAESFSGPIAISLAASGAANLRGLVLCCTFVSNPRPALSVGLPLVGILPVTLAPMAALSHLLLGRFSTEALRSALLQAMKQVSPAALRARLKAVILVNVADKLSSVSVPVLYLRATQDRLVPPSASQLVSMLAPGAEIVELDAPHFLLQAAPVAAARVVGDFVREVQISSEPPQNRNTSMTAPLSSR
jgi:pimeloyl-ACP methyl ester carboxylesterase